MNKKRYELVFITDGSEQDSTAISEVIGLVVKLVATTNTEAAKSLLRLRVKLKERH